MLVYCVCLLSFFSVFFLCALRCSIIHVYTTTDIRTLYPVSIKSLQRYCCTLSIILQPQRVSVSCVATRMIWNIPCCYDSHNDCEKPPVMKDITNHDMIVLWRVLIIEISHCMGGSKVQQSVYNLLVCGTHQWGITSKLGYNFQVGKLYLTFFI